MPSKLLNYKGLYGDQQQPFSEGFVHHESLQTRSERYNWDIGEHLHTDLFQIFIITSGNGLLISEHKKIALKSPCILLIPNNTLHGFAFQANTCGEVFTFSESFFEHIFKNAPHVRHELSRLRQYSFESPSAFFEEVLFLKDKLAGELNSEKPEKQSAVQLLFQLLLLGLYRANLDSEPPTTRSDNRTLDYFHSFQKRLRQSIYESRSVSGYAKELNITTVHLNRICRALVQKSALQVVHEYWIAEAKKYLRETAYSISEVSYFLDFKDPAHFSKLFKKHTGLTPGEFRKKSG